MFQAWRSAAACANLEVYASRVLDDPRYREDHAPAAPRKIGRRLWAFDCLSCDKCLPVCPNAAIFTFTLPRGARTRPVLGLVDGTWRVVAERTLTLDGPHQIAILDDLCNDCGNCDVFCPEDGGPNLRKPRLFGTEDGWRAATIDGYFVAHRDGADVTLARHDGREYRAEVVGHRTCFDGPGFSVVLDGTSSPGIAGRADEGAEVDLLWLDTMTALHRAVRSPATLNWVNCLDTAPPTT